MFQKRCIFQICLTCTGFPITDVPDSKTFDVTLMIVLLRNLTKMAAPRLGFENLPPATETTPGADLARIKYYRNYLAHLDDSKIETTFINTAWIDLTGVCNVFHFLLNRLL